ncbi:MAG: type II toxin-antitoxin system HicB family antitoxin [Enterobacteriaceae bacterium]|nr:type II toxin-antitoxin system HicB family antitoxin [Enterobacteriaceae bacterium]
MADASGKKLTSFTVRIFMVVPSRHPVISKAEDCQGGIWAYVDIDMSKYDGKAVKLNITLPQNLLFKIDAYVGLNSEYGSRSGFFAELARRELQKRA